MRVYVFVAIFISGVSFCFAVRLRAKACNVTDVNGRDLLCTRVHKADLISDETQSHNVEHAENEAHLVKKENEARMQDGAMHVMLEKLLEWQELPLNAMDRVEELIHDVSVVKKPRLESSPAYQFAQPQPIDAASHSNHPGDKIGKSLIANLEGNYYHENMTPIEWLKHVNAYWIISNLDDSIEKYDNTKLLAFLAEKFKPRGVVDLFGKLANIPNCERFAEDVQRTMVLDSTYKDLVFGLWIDKGYSPETILDIFFFTHKPAVIKVTDQLFLVWLGYFTWYWKLTNSKSPLRYVDFLKALRKYLPIDYLDEMIPSQALKEAFLKQQVDGVLDDLNIIRWTWLMDYFLRKKVRPDRVFLKINKYLHDLDNPDSPVLLWMLNYVVWYRRQSTFTNTELFIFLTSKLSFESLMKMLRSQWKSPQFKKLANDMLNSMFSSTTMLTTLAKSGVKLEEYFRHLVSVYNTAATSSEPKFMALTIRYDMASQYLKYALVVDYHIRNMKYDDSSFDKSFNTSFDFLSKEMNDISDSFLKKLLHDMLMMVTCRFKISVVMLSAANYPLHEVRMTAELIFSTLCLDLSSVYEPARKFGRSHRSHNSSVKPNSQLSISLLV
ncbi:hypothetical protein Plhal304r1_c031g0101421 [Plasmopara halstedii]